MGLCLGEDFLLLGVVSGLFYGLGWRTAGGDWGWGRFLEGFLLLGEGLEEEFGEEGFGASGVVGLGNFDELAD